MWRPGDITIATLTRWVLLSSGPVPFRSIGEGDFSLAPASVSLFYTVARMPCITAIVIQAPKEGKGRRRRDRDIEQRNSHKYPTPRAHTNRRQVDIREPGNAKLSVAYSPQPWTRASTRRFKKNWANEKLFFGVPVLYGQTWVRENFEHLTVEQKSEKNDQARGRCWKD